MPLITREIRWFFGGSLAATGAAIGAWFAGASGGGQGLGTLVWPQEWRIDDYLRLPNAEDVGVKLRQGRLEIKGRHCLVGIQRFGDGVEGQVECWTKWALAAPEWKAGGGARPTIEGPGLLRIAKQRVLRTVRFTQDSIVEVPAGQEVDQGLHMELTRIRVAEAPTDTHWSLGFEAFPDGPSCCESFAKAVAQLLKGYPAKPLGADRSMSYPCWLQRLDDGNPSRPE